MHGRDIVGKNRAAVINVADTIIASAINHVSIIVAVTMAVTAPNTCPGS